jgi:hypothetical protein
MSHLLLPILITLLIILIFLNIPQIDPADTIPFSSVRQHLKTGDVLVLSNWHGSSAIIRAIDRSPASHTAIIVRTDEQIYACDLDFHTWFDHDVKVTPIDEFLKNHWPLCGIVPCRHELPLRLQDIERIKCKFDLTFRARPLPGRILCTQFVHRLHSRFGLLPWNGATESETTPATYYSDPRIVLVDSRR